MAFPVHAGFTFAKSHTDSYPFIASPSQKGRSVFITGASKGIGMATAVSFARAGASHIAVAARSSLDAVESKIIAAATDAGHPVPKTLKITLDVANNDEVVAAAELVDREFGGKLDVIVNNAGSMGIWKLLGDSDPTTWWDVLEVNLKGPYLVTHAFLPMLLKSEQRTIVNISSIGAHITRPSASAYQISKFALLRLNQFTAVEYANQGIICIALNPGAVATEMVVANLPLDSHHKLVDSPELGADTVAWLTQNRQEWLSGRYLSANWDMEEIFGRKDEIINEDKLKVRLAL